MMLQNALAVFEFFSGFQDMVGTMSDFGNTAKSAAMNCNLKYDKL